jgi:hypothetical protein
MILPQNNGYHRYIALCWFKCTTKHRDFLIITIGQTKTIEISDSKLMAAELNDLKKLVRSSNN